MKKLKNLFVDVKTRYRNLILVLLPFIVIIIILSIFAYNSLKNISNSDNVVLGDEYKIEEYDYQLRDNATELQKEYFKELKNDLKNKEDDLKIAEDIAKNYIADYYTWTNKNGQYDVGGMCYICGYNKINYYLKARSSFYKYLGDYIVEYGNDDLLEVSNINIINSFKGKELYKLNENEEYEYYVIELEWEYKPTNKFKIEDFITKVTVKVLHYGENERYEVIEVFREI